MSTWGQLRFSLQVSAPGVPPDLLDEYLNSRYEQTLESCDWTGVKYHTTLMTTAAYQSANDNVTLTMGSANVVGVGTTWLSGITTQAAVVGQKFYQPGDSVIYTITTVASDTSLTLDRPYEGNGVDGVGTVYTLCGYVFMQNIYQLPPDVRTVVSCLDPVTNFPLTQYSKDYLDQSAGPRTLVENPGGFAVYDDSPDSNPPVVHQIEFFPPPLYARGIPVEYLHAGLGFDGSNTSGAPMPWVSDTVLRYGCRADIAMYLAGEAANPGQASVYLKQAAGYEGQFQVELRRLLMIEHAQRRVKVPLRMASRFVRHRLERASRGMNSSWRGGIPGGPN